MSSQEDPSVLYPWGHALRRSVPPTQTQEYAPSDQAKRRDHHSKIPKLTTMYSMVLWSVLYEAAGRNGTNVGCSRGPQDLPVGWKMIDGN